VIAGAHAALPLRGLSGRADLRLHCADHDLIAVEEPFTLLIWVIIDAHHAAAKRCAEHLDDCPNMADQIGDGALPLPNPYSIPVVDVALGRLWDYFALTHGSPLSVLCRKKRKERAGYDPCVALFAFGSRLAAPLCRSLGDER